MVCWLLDPPCWREPSAGFCGAHGTQSSLVSVVGTKTECSKVVGESVLYQASSTSSKELRAGRKVTLTGFRAFCESTRKVRWVNPSTREAVNVPGKRVVTVRASGRLKKLVENK
ncbi:HU family DNA-binding protein [bacterium]|nr:HU family DNA-binding protein [bacterium]